MFYVFMIFYCCRNVCYFWHRRHRWRRLQFGPRPESGPGTTPWNGSCVAFCLAVNMSISVAPLRPLSMAKIKLPLSSHHALREFRIHFNVNVDFDFDFILVFAHSLAFKCGYIIFLLKAISVASPLSFSYAFVNCQHLFGLISTSWLGLFRQLNSYVAFCAIFL